MTYTAQQICYRLAEEFPGRSVNFEMSCWSHDSGSKDCGCMIYDVAGTRCVNIKCANLEDGIAKLKAHLSPRPCDMEIDMPGGAS